MVVSKKSIHLVGVILLLFCLNSCDKIKFIDDDPNGSCTIDPPTAGTHEPGQTQIVWNWNAVAGATGYKYNTVDDYATASDHGTATSYTQTGLNCDNAYVLYVWAYKDCGNSTSLQLSQSTSSCNSIPGCGTVTFTYKGQTVTYGTVTGANGRCWLDRNLGASQVATSSSDILAYGDLFQWGRLDDGHQERTSPTTSNLSNSDEPGHDLFITGGFGVSDWRSPRNDNLWQGVDGLNNPCPNGFRVPTEAEWDTERQSWNSSDSKGAFESPLKLPLAGVRSTLNGTVHSEGAIGRYWSSSVYGHLSWHLDFDLSVTSLDYSDGRIPGCCVRCIKD